MQGKVITKEEIEGFQELLRRLNTALTHAGLPKDKRLSPKDGATLANLIDFLESVRSFIQITVPGGKSED